MRIDAPLPRARTRPGSMRENDEIVMEMAGQAVPSEDVIGILDGMAYYGCIQDHFYPAEQKSGEKISKMFEKTEAPAD